jgi:hypothetical protein
MMIYVCLFNWYLMIEISSIYMIFSISIFKDGISKLVSKYKFQLVSIKTLLKTKRRILFRGVLFQNLKMLLAILFIYL